jgi:catechol 2,3-dioxygenase-like lactoylglutathione lyase family enzyme
MVNGVHVLVYTSNPDADRAFFRDVLGFKYVDVGHGWLIFALPPAEAAFHPLDDSPSGQLHAPQKMLGAVVYLMCDDVRATVKTLGAKGVTCTEIEEERWGLRTTVRMPSGGEIGLYQPKHETALNL